MFGWDLIFSVTARANASRSTASAPPASTRFASAQARIRLSRRRSSSLSSPAALVSSSERSEFEQTSSAKSSEWCAGLCCTGFISCRRTLTPRCASCHAASQPARPAPTTVTVSTIGGLLCCSLFGSPFRLLRRLFLFIFRQRLGVLRLLGLSQRLHVLFFELFEAVRGLGHPRHLLFRSGLFGCRGLFRRGVLGRGRFFRFLLGLLFALARVFLRLLGPCVSGRLSG